MNSVEDIIKVNGLSKTFTTRKNDNTAAVNNVSFAVHKGEILGIVGESGSGKSTIAKLLTGLISPTNGDIRICGSDIKSLKKKPIDLYGKIQMVFQNPVESFNPRKTLGYCIAEPLRNRGYSKSDAEKKVAELLEICGLTPDFANKLPGQVSGGQCQRAAIARALAVQPEILICDEATSSLDVTVQKQIIELLNTLKEKQNLSIIFICHNIALVKMFCDRVIVLYDGQIVEQGTLDSIINNPQAEYTKLLLDSVL